MQKPYCTQNDGNCRTCSLMNQDRDCLNNPVLEEMRAVEIVKLSEAQFQHEMAMAKTFQSVEPARAEYWAGVQRGLRRAYHGVAFGTSEEHALWLAAVDSDVLRQQRGQGYMDGLKGQCRGAGNDGRHVI